MRRLSKEVELVSKNLASTYEEISLLYAVTQNLRISSTDEELGRLAIEWLGECVSAQAFAVMYLPTAAADDETYKSRTKPLFITSGDCPVQEEGFARLIDILDLDVSAWRKKKSTKSFAATPESIGTRRSSRRSSKPAKRSVRSLAATEVKSTHSSSSSFDPTVARRARVPVLRPA